MGALGILWTPEQDTLLLRIGSVWAGIKEPTKRLVLASIARTFNGGLGCTGNGCSKDLVAKYMESNSGSRTSGAVEVSMAMISQECTGAGQHANTSVDGDPGKKRTSCVC